MPIDLIKLKTILDACVRPDYRDYTLKLSDLQTKRRRATYFFKTKEIVIYRGEKNWANVFCYCIHELAHHVTSKEHWLYWAEKKKRAPKRRNRSGRFVSSYHVPIHGREFVKTLDVTIFMFNQLYRHRLHGEIVFNKKKPRITPVWRKVNATGIGM